ncbi:hypothetical protein SNE40_012182 [Patella caerulea]|uniref:G-protein coupled receptors family 1 profile domain-containing protein n=1 Tax=Patella caerulea TaxID=87958 RepID=A0AAN8JNM3_PATCE
MDVYQVASWGAMLVTIEVLLILLIPLGNGVIIAAVLTHRQLRKPGDILVANLATADIVIGTFVLPFDLYVVVAQKYFQVAIPCCVIPFSWILALTFSVQCLFFIALEKYFAILYPLKHLALATNKKALLAGIGGWLFAVIVSVCSMLVRNEWTSEILCPFQPNFMTVFNSSFITFLIITSVFMYIRVFATLVKPTVLPHGSAVFRSRRCHIKKTKMMAVVLFMFVLFWSPLIVYFLYMNITRQQAFTPIARLFVLLGTCNSLINCIVYLCKREEFRKMVLNVFKRRKPRTEA